MPFYPGQHVFGDGPPAQWTESVRMMNSPQAKLLRKILAPFKEISEMWDTVTVGENCIYNALSVYWLMLVP